MKGTIISIAVTALLIGGVIFLGKDSGKEIEIQSSTLIEGEMSLNSQIIEIDAKGGYSPQKVLAKAGIPTTIKVITNGTFDCSSALTIPSIGYRKNLPPSGVTEIEVPPQAAGTILEGMCQMGMYSFAINFN